MDERRQPLMEHLRDLRGCIRNSAIALFVGFAIAYAFSQDLYRLLAEPLMVAWAKADLGDAKLHQGSLTEPIWVFIDLSLYAGVFIASPVIFHQIWRFVAPGLYQREKRVALPFAFFSALFFVGGAVFCYFLVLPPAFAFFLSYSTENLGKMAEALPFLSGGSLAIETTLFMEKYLDLVLKLLLGFGIVFELPLLIFFLSYSGIVTHRGLWKFNKYAIILSFILGAVLTPGPDIVSQLLMAGPLVLLYNMSILVALLVTRSRKKRAAAEAAAASESTGPEGKAG